MDHIDDKIDQLPCKTLAVLPMGEAESGEDDWAVFLGIIRWEGDTAYLDRGEANERSEWLNRIKSVDDDLSDILQGCELYLPLPVVNLPPDHDSAEFELTGLKWPE